MKKLKTFKKYAGLLILLVLLMPVSLKAQYAPYIPSNLTATSVYTDQIKLWWDDNSGNEDGFNIYQVLDPALEPILLESVPPNTEYYYVAGLLPGTTYYFYVQAYNQYGASGYSNLAWATTHLNLPGTPNAPTNLEVVSIGSNRVTMQWEDNSSDEDGFKIARKTSNDLFFVIIDSVETDVLTYQEVGLSPEVDYIYKVCSYNEYGFSAYTNTIEVRITKNHSSVFEDKAVSSNFHLGNNYPNPFNPVTRINFNIPEASRVKLTVYNALGQSVAELVNNHMEQGSYSVEWNASRFSSGIYYYKMETEGFTQIKKMILIK